MAELRALSAFDGLLTSVGSGAGVTARDLGAMSVAGVMRVGEAGLPWPDAPRRSVVNGLTVLGVSRDSWLVVGESGPRLAATLAKLAGKAHVVDQSGAYGLLELGGPCVEAVLAKGLDVDLHPAAFPQDGVATSRIAHIGVTLWRAGEAGGLRLATPRSSAGSFMHWLSASAAEFGLTIL